MAEKLLRGKEALTSYRGANGAAGGYLYRGGLLDENAVDPKAVKRLVEEGFIERVVRDGETFRLAEDTPTGDKGDPVTVGDNGFPPETEVDHGTINEGGVGLVDAERRTEAEQAAQAEADSETAKRRAEAKAKLPEDGSAPKGTAGKDVLVEYLVANGYLYTELIKHDRSELSEMVKTVKS
mgnify:FL=1